MAGLKQIKTKIVAMKKSQTVTRAMEAVSAAKMRRAQQTALGGRAYARAAAQVLARVAGSRELSSHPLVRYQRPDKRLYIVITSDKGLAGALNSAVIRTIRQDIHELEQYSLEKPKFIAIGRKARDFFKNHGYEIVQYYPNTAGLNPAQMSEVLDTATKLFTEGEVDAVKIAYQNFVSTFEQRPTMRTVLPLSLPELQKVVDDIVPKRGAYADQEAPGSPQPSAYTLEPSEAGVLGAILPLLASVIVHHALLESQASEHSARMVAMKSASDKAGEREHALTLQFNKARQAAITREVSEITGGMEAMAG